MYFWINANFIEIYDTAIDLKSLENEVKFFRSKLESVEKLFEIARVVGIGFKITSVCKRSAEHHNNLLNFWSEFDTLHLWRTTSGSHRT